MKNTEKIQQLRQRLLQMDNEEFDEVLNEGNDIDKRTWSTIQRNYQRTDYLRFKPELIYKLAEPFTTAQSMIDYKGENEVQINAAGRYLQYNWKGQYPRPEWFSSDKLNQTKEEVVAEAKKLRGKFNDIPDTLKQKLWRHYDSNELKTLLPNLSWSRKPKTDDERYDILNQYKTAAECRNSSKQNKNMLSQVSTDKGVKYPRTYALLQEKKSGHTSTRSKRGSYKQRTPAIIQCDLDKNVIQVFKTWDDVLDAGFKRSSVASAIRGTDGHNKHKGYLWRHEYQDFTK